MTAEELEQLIRRDPAARGLAAAAAAEVLCDGHLAQAADELSERAGSVAIVTGFFVPDSEIPAAETDGLTGSVLLAAVLRSLQHNVVLITDELCAPALAIVAASAGCHSAEVLACPCDPAAAEQWRKDFWSDAGAGLSHLIAIERAAPAYTPQLLASRCDATAGDATDALMQQFVAEVPATSFGRCHNMRGVDIHDGTADLHLLFEDPPPGVRTIGIGDGGNEIGMGNIPWQQLLKIIPSHCSGRIAGRTKTDWTIVAGVSDWGAMSLAATFCLLRENLQPLSPWTADRVERLLESAVKTGPAVDGITRQLEPTVDGLPFITYIQPWLHIRRQLGLDEI